MSSRQEEKAQRRAEREAAEQAAASAQARTKRLRAAVTALMAIAAVVVVVLLATSGSDDAPSTSPGPSSSAGGASIPEVAERDLDKAVEAAGCTLRNNPDDGSEHTSEPVTYKIKPPTSGPHSPEAALDGIYDVANPPKAENAVHALEHGRVAFQYRQGTATDRIAQLETLASEPLNGKNAYKVLLLRDTTGMDAAVAATAWTQSLTCPKITDATFDAFRAFRVKYVDKGPEAGIPPNN